VAIGLLFIQAMSDLSLPTYLSEIVNVGIQQTGIEDAVPQAVRQTTFLQLLEKVPVLDREKVHADYQFIDQTLTNEARYLRTYPVLATQPIYLLKPISAKERAQLDQIFQKAALGQQQLAISTVKTEYLALGINVMALQNQTILKIGLLMLAISLLSGSCTIAVGFLSARIAAGFSRDLRRALFRKVESFSKVELDRFTTSSLITRTTNDITQIQTTIMILIRMAFYAPIIGVGGIILALRTSPSMSWMIVLAVVLLIGLIAVIFSLTVPQFALIQKLLDRLNLVTSENLSGMMVIRAFNTEKFEEKRFDRANQDLTQVNLFVNRVMSLMQPLMMLLMSGLTVLIVWVGAHQIAQSTLQVGNMIAFMQYSVQIVFAFMFLSFMFLICPELQFQLAGLLRC
jgi:ATP-binding cassette subfamily B protein